MAKRFVGKRVTIRQDQARWLDENPEISLSGLTQKAIDNFIIEMNGVYKDIIRAIGDRNPQAPDFFLNVKDISGNLLKAYSSTSENEVREILGILKEMGYVETRGTPIEEARLTATGRQNWRKIRANYAKWTT